MIRLFAILLFAFTFSAAVGQERRAEVAGFAASLLFKTDDDGNIQPRAMTQKIFRSDNPRLIAIALNVSLGMFGMHRLYLGTDVKVPIFYTVTIGGGMALWAADLILLLTADDLEKFIDNPHVFMWNEK
jgi:TM2 domain-containing membrane protein YozV